MNDRFPGFYSRRRQALGAAYRDTEFLYPNNEPWPEQSFDYPYGQAPTVSNLPPDERADWAAHVGQYYRDNAVGKLDDGKVELANVSPFGQQAAEFAREQFARHGVTGYGALADDLFLELLCEGLYSKYLGRLDPFDQRLFGVADDAEWEYLKSDQSCMKVVTQPWPGEYVAPAIAIVRRRRGAAGTYAWQLCAIALARAADGAYEFVPELVLTPAQHGATAAWWLAKYYVLQGAIHRINLVDHIKVHFPGDAINAITKSVLPRWHLVQMLLLPHFRLQLPVNNAVLEGDRSLINRDTWYPWSPVTARGEEIRKLIPLAWAGSGFYWDTPNSAYPAYRFSADPRTVPDPERPGERLETFIGLGVSRYAKFLEDYHAPVLEFTRKVIALLPDPAREPELDGLEWLEIQRWAHEISRLVPGFPDEQGIRSKETLAQVCATVIWNAAIVHSSDHSALHLMMDRDPVPFILRVRPPSSAADHATETIGEAIGAKGVQYLEGAVRGVEKLLLEAVDAKLNKGRWFDKPAEALATDAIKLAVARALEGIEDHVLSPGSVPLCWPTDLIYAKLADLLFYRPHNSSVLYDCEYPFLQQSPADLAREQQWRAAGIDRPLLDGAQRQQLQGIVKEFQAALEAVHLRWYDENGRPREGEPVQVSDLPCVLNRWGFPKLKPGTEDRDVAATRMQACFGAGIQY